MHKVVGNPFESFDHRGWKNVVAGVNKVMIGHNRFATTGKINKANAHPFEFDRVVGVHNGTLRNKYKLLEGHKFDVDSEALYHHINEKGIDDAINTAEGAWALVWYDKEASTLNFLRNNERPMNIVFSEDFRTMYWASEAWMLTAILGRDAVKHTDIVKLPEDVLYSYQIPEAGKQFEKARVRRVVKPVVVQMESYKPPVHPAVQQGTADPKKEGGSSDSGKKYVGSTLEFLVLGIESNTIGAKYALLEYESDTKIDFRLFLNNQIDFELKANMTIRGTVSTFAEAHGEKYYKISPMSVEPALPRKQDHKGRFIDEKEFNRRYTTCAWCTSPVTFDEDVVFMSETECLCSSCKDDEEIKQYLPALRMA